MSFASGKHSLAICDKCSRDVPYTSLKEEFVRGKGKNNKVCPECYDPDHPQNWYGTEHFVDPEGIQDARPEDFEAVRSLAGWGPVGAPGNKLSLDGGIVSVRT